MSDDTAAEEVTLGELLELAAASKMLDVHTSIPARVVNYDHTKQTVTLQILVNRMVPDGNGGFVSEPFPQLLDVPVRFPRCRQFTITFPLVAGDCGRLVFSERSIAAWRTTGSQCDPGDLDMHGLDGATFDPGLDDDAHPAASHSATDMFVGSDTAAESRIRFKPSGGMQLGDGATLGVARKTDGLTASSQLAAWALVVETVINGVIPGTFNALNQFAGATIGNPGKAGALGVIEGGSANIKAVD